MKKLIMVTVIAACLALCAAVWPQTEVVEKTPTSAPTPAVSAPEPPVEELKTKVEAAPQTKKRLRFRSRNRAMRSSANRR